MTPRLRARVSSDLLLGMGFAAAWELEAAVRAGGQPGQFAVAAPGGLTFLPLAWRRSRPLLAMTLLTVLAAGGSLLQALVPLPGAGSGEVLVPIVAMLVASYSLGAHGSPLELALGALQPLLLIIAVDLLQPGSQSLSGALLFFAVFIVGAPALAGRVVRARLVLLGRLKEQEHQIDVERAARTSAAVAVERLQLTDRLHERLVAGMESLIDQVVVAQNSRADRQANVVASIEAAARSLLAETRKVVVSLASSSRSDGMTHEQSPLRGQLRRQTQEAQNNSALPWTAIAAATVCVGLLVEVKALHLRVSLPIALLGCFVIAAPIAFAWSRPLLMTAALWAAAALFSMLVVPLADTFTAIALSFLLPSTAAFFETRKRAVVGLGICGLGALACFGPDAFAGNVAFALCAWIAGRVLRDRSRLVDELRFNNQWLADQREAAMRQAVLEERARVARELHDAIGHSLTVIALQAGAARRLWSSDRKKAKAALQTIGHVAVDGLADLRLGFGSNDLLAQIGSQRRARLNDVKALVDGARAAGLTVGLHIDWHEGRLSADAELTAFRILQEALTNVLRHAPGATAEVSIRNRGSHVEVVVSNSANDRSPLESANGAQGLIGMEQRVEACGGRLNWGARADGGFEVRAQLPAQTVNV